MRWGGWVRVGGVFGVFYYDLIQDKGMSKGFFYKPRRAAAQHGGMVQCAAAGLPVRLQPCPRGAAQPMPKL
jgi:hypothetical protein